MAATVVVPDVWQVSLGSVNAFVVDLGGELTLIDTGLPGSAAKIEAAVRSMGRKPTDIRRVIVTHCHPDHAGSLAAVKRVSAAPAVMHAADAEMVRRGASSRGMRPAPGLARQLMFRLFVGDRRVPIDATDVEHEVADSDTIGGAKGLRVVHVPGHCAGQVALYWADRGVLFAADAAGNLPRLGLSLGYEELDLGLRSLARLAALDFEVACFGHGKPITRGAAAQFRQRWA